MNAPRVTPWPGPGQPDEAILRARFHAEGMECYVWSNGPSDSYNAHNHLFCKSIYVLSGSITFILKEGDRVFTLKPGDRIDLPAGTVHSAVVGPQGVTCLECHRVEK